MSRSSVRLFRSRWSFSRAALPRVSVLFVLSNAAIRLSNVAVQEHVEIADATSNSNHRVIVEPTFPYMRSNRRWTYRCIHFLINPKDLHDRKAKNAKELFL